jgi:hypothetical protein
MAKNTDKSPANGLQGTSYLYDYGTSPNTRTAVSQKVRILTPVYGDNNAMHQMGVVSSFNPSQSRTVEPVRGIGFGDQVAELVPSVTEPTTGSFERALLYLCNLWQATGYASGVDGPVRSLAHHRWPFDIEQQLVFSTLADVDVGVANTGYGGAGGVFDGGVSKVVYPQTTVDGPDFSGAATSGGDAAGKPPETPGHTAIITMYEACWFTSWGATFAKDAGMIMETGDVTVSDVHDFSSYYGEFLATGNDPTIGQLGSIRFSGDAGGGGKVATGGMTVDAEDDVDPDPDEEP